MNGETWSVDWTRATLPLSTLLLLQHKPAHGYLLLRSLEKQGYSGIKGSTLYPLLGRLAERGWVDHHWDHADAGPGRKIFTITAAGEEKVKMLRDEWDAVATMMAASIDIIEEE